MFIVTFVTFGFWMQHFQTGGLIEMVQHPGQHDRQISPSLNSFYGGMLGTKFQILQIWRQEQQTLWYNTWRHVGEHVERNWLSIRRSSCNKRNTCWSALMCCKNFLSYVLKKKSLYSMGRSFLVITVCNQGKILCSSCISLKFSIWNLSL